MLMLTMMMMMMMIKHQGTTNYKECICKNLIQGGTSIDFCQYHHMVTGRKP
jgi:hypothetical protein